MKILSMIAFVMTALGSMGASTQTVSGAPAPEDGEPLSGPTG